MRLATRPGPPLARHSTVQRYCSARARARGLIRPAASRAQAAHRTDPSISRTLRLRELLQAPGILKGPCCHDGISAKLIEQAGFEFAFMSGFCTSAARLGAPDAGLLSYYEMLDQGRCIHEATRSLPIIGDADTGYGNALNVKRTVRGYAAAGFAGVLIEDQVWPKSCGHVRSKRVVDRQEAVARIRAAADARDEGADILVVARTDARQAESLEEALWRVRAFAEAGADVLFVDALESEDEMRRFTGLGGSARDVPKMANMLEGGGRTPLLPPEQLASMGFKLVAYPLSLLGVSVVAMQRALEGLRTGRTPPQEAMGTFAGLQDVVGFPEYYEEAARYSDGEAGTGRSQEGSAQQAAPPGSWVADAPTSEPSTTAGDSDGGSSSSTTSGDEFKVEVEQLGQGGTNSGAKAAVEPDAVFERSAGAGTGVLVSSAASSSGRDDWEKNFRRSRFLRVKIANASTGLTKLETRIPAGFLDGLEAIVPQVSGMKLEAVMEEALGKEWDLSKPIVSFNSGTDVVQIFLE